MSSSKFSKFSSTSALTLALTWVLSFRPVRLTIGDYHFKQGKFDQAANWYEKVLRKAGLKYFYNRSSKIQSITAEDQKILTKFKEACFNSAKFHFNQSAKYLLTDINLAEKALKMVILNYDIFNRNAYNWLISDERNSASQYFNGELFSIFKKVYINLIQIINQKNPRNYQNCTGGF